MPSLKVLLLLLHAADVLAYCNVGEWKDGASGPCITHAVCKPGTFEAVKGGDFYDTVCCAEGREYAVEKPVRRRLERSSTSTETSADAVLEKSSQPSDPLDMARSGDAVRGGRRGLNPTPEYTCEALTVCKSYEVESVAPTATSDRQCALRHPNDPLCFCDTLSHGMTSAADGKQACMKWHKNNPFLSAIKDSDGLPAPEGPDTGGYQIECVWPDKGLATGAAEEYEEGWEGNCAADWTKCTFVHQKPDWQHECSPSCQCDIYKDGAHPVHTAQHMCVITEKIELTDGKITEQNVCTVPVNGYELRFGESLQNWGCDHPARPCMHESTKTCDPALKACFGKPTVGTADADGLLEGEGEGHGCKLIDDDGALCLDETITSIAAAAFKECGTANGDVELTSAHLPEVKTINGLDFGGEGGAFEGSGKLTHVVMPEVTALLIGAFISSGLTSVDAPKLEVLGAQAFDGSKQLTRVNLPKLKVLGGKGFGNTAITSLELPELREIQKLGLGEMPLLESISMPKIKKLAETAFGTDGSPQDDVNNDPAKLASTAKFPALTSIVPKTPPDGFQFPDCAERTCQIKCCEEPMTCAEWCPN